MDSGSQAGLCDISPWLYNVCTDGAVREVNAGVLGRGLKLLRRIWFADQLLFADDTTLVAASEKKLCRRLSEFGKIYERRKLLRANVGKSNVMRYSKLVYIWRIDAGLNGEQLEEEDWFK